MEDSKQFNQNNEIVKEKNILPGAVKLVLRIIIFLLVSWILVHLFAAFGIFFVIAYPFGAVLFSGKVTSLFGVTKRYGSDRFFSSSFGTIALNTIMLIGFTGLSVALVYVETRIINDYVIVDNSKTVVFEIPREGQYKLGEIFSVKVDISGIEVPINTIQADVTFDNERLEVLDVSTKNSFATIFIQKEINNELGYVRLTGGLPNPGYYGDDGEFMSIIFQSIQPGSAKVEFLGSSLVLANDGEGTNILKETQIGSYLILPESISRTELELQDKLLSEDVLGVEDDRSKLYFYKGDSSYQSLEVDYDKTFEEEEPIETYGIVEMLGNVNEDILNVWGLFIYGE